jgi:hypothetical protein
MQREKEKKGKKGKLEGVALQAKRESESKGDRELSPGLSLPHAQ